MERVRIVDIAEELGLSTATVSNVIHGKTKKISAETVKRVQKKLEEKGYIPNMAGILLAQNSSRIVGVVINDHEKYEGHVLEDGFVSSSLNALSGELSEAGYFMMVRVTGDCDEIVRLASMWNMEGLVLMGFCDHDYIQLRSSMHIPFVVYDGYFQDAEGICNLVIDNYDGGMQAGRYFRACSHKKVLCIADNYICVDKERMDGLRAAMGSYGADFLEIPMAKEDRIPFYEERLGLILQYTGVFAVSDYYAIEMIHFLQAHGFRVPDDISVIGFDDSQWCEKIYPTLTTVHQAMDERARRAVQILQELKNGICEQGNVIFPVQLIKRGSVKVLSQVKDKGGDYDEK